MDIPATKTRPNQSSRLTSKPKWHKGVLALVVFQIACNLIFLEGLRSTKKTSDLAFAESVSLTRDWFEAAHPQPAPPLDYDALVKKYGPLPEPK